MTIMTEDGGYIVGIGGSMILYSLYSTVKIKIENSCLILRDALLFLRTGECTHERIKKTLNQLLTIKSELMGINCEEAVYNCDNLTETAPWKDNISSSVKNCYELFTTDNGKNIIDEFIALLDYANRNKLDVVIP